MKPLSEVIHRTPWWALMLGGLLTFLGLAVFVTPYNIIGYSDNAAASVENLAIKREMDRAFADSAIDLARQVLLSMRGATKDPIRREELNEALGELDEARRELREASSEAARTRREAAKDARTAARDATRALEEARREAQSAFPEGTGGEELQKSLDESLAAARKAEEQAKAAAREAARTARDKIKEAAQAAREDGKSHIEIQIPPRIGFQIPGNPRPMFEIELGDVAVDARGVPELPPEIREQIRRGVSGDLWRIGVGAGLILILIPLFVLAMVSKFFIDRSRASLRMAELKRKEAEYARMAQQVTEAKLSALQAQVEPHFLYNTLSSVQALTEVDPAQASAMTGHLIQYLRNALPKMRESVSTVGQEVELVRAYLNILKMRMGRRLEFDIAVPPELLEVAFPPLMLPSLVENAIKHGLEPQREGGYVHIRAESLDGRLRMVVSDTGRGFAEVIGAGVGLANIRERLAAMYGTDARLTLVANEPRGVTATLDVPMRRPPGGFQAAPGPVAEGAPGGAEPAKAEAPRTRTQRTLAAMGTAERTWRKALSFAFVVLVVVAAVVAGLAIVGVAAGVIPVQVGQHAIAGPMGALVGTAGIAIGFAAVVLALGIVLAVIYGIGFLFVGLAIFIPLVVLVAMVPALAPFILVGLGIWWWVRRRERHRSAAAPAAAPASVSPGPPPGAP